MKIKKFTAHTESAAIEKVKDELGPDALVINIKKVQPTGFFAMFRKVVVEVTAAYEDVPAVQEARDVKPEVKSQNFDKIERAEKTKVSGNNDVHKFEAATKDVKIAAQDDKIKMLQDMLYTTGDMLARAQEQLSVSRHRSDAARKYQNNLVQVFYDTLVENGVTSGIADEILGDLDNLESDENLDINFLVKIVYNSIINIIGGSLPTQAASHPRKIAFIGPTGVGKTTTIAKLTAEFILKDNLDVGLITADTYRIAAVEQLRTYGDIFGIDVQVVYRPEDLQKHLKDLAMRDVVLIDTAGRSHKNSKHLSELQEMLEVMPDMEKYLVLSLTTKFEDMLDIVNTFSGLCDFGIIFTKLDETLQMGAVLNICHQTGKKLSYITFGQNVPDDIKKVEPNEVAMQLLGLGEELEA